MTLKFFLKVVSVGQNEILMLRILRGNVLVQCIFHVVVIKLKNMSI